MHQVIWHKLNLTPFKMTPSNILKFSTRELNELNILLDNLPSNVTLKTTATWLYPTKTYDDISFKDPVLDLSYTNVLELTIDRLYYLLNIILWTLESFTDKNIVNLFFPKRLTMGSLSRIIIDKLSAFNLLQTKKQLITRDIGIQTSYAPNGRQDGDCQSCVVLFKEINNIIGSFDDHIELSNFKKAKHKVRNNLLVLNNSQSMSVLCAAIREDLRLFLSDYQALNESHASLQQQYDMLMDDFINYMADCNASFIQNEDALKTLTNKVDKWHGGFASELQLLCESSGAISAACNEDKRFLQDVKNNLVELENQQQINTLQNTSLKILAKELESHKARESSVEEQMIVSIDICAEKIALLQRRVQMLQLKASNLQANEEANETDEYKGLAGPLAGNNPIEDMLQHVESNKLKIDYLQRENVALQRTIAQIKMRVTY